MKLIDAPSVQTHVLTYQAVIARMSSNSSASKTWCITLVGAAAIFDRLSNLQLVYVLFPVILFGILDAYYLSKEQSFRDQYSTFISKIKNNEDLGNDLFEVKSSKVTFRRWLKATSSFSIWPIYLSLTLLIICVQIIEGCTS